jgi:aminoglycoside phosphotransferase (APT) family kinase protein
MDFLALGRDADVFALDEGLVLRRYRTPHDTIREGAVMQWAAAAGIPVPAVHEVTATDMVLDRVHGTTMLDDLLAHPWRARRHAATLSGLHRRLGGVTAPEWLPAPVGDGDSLLHLDLHPGNVMLGRDGPVIIDWANAARGPAGADPATVWLMGRVASLPGSPVLRIRFGLARRAFTSAFLAGFDRTDVARHLPRLAAMRLADPNTLEVERRRIRRLVGAMA